MVVIDEPQLLSDSLLDQLQQLFRRLLPVVHDLVVDPRTALAVRKVDEFFERQMVKPERLCRIDSLADPDLSQQGVQRGVVDHASI